MTFEDNSTDRWDRIGEELSIGVNHCPVIDIVKCLAVGLPEQMSAAKCPIEKSNVYMTYMLVMNGYATAQRSICNPLPLSQYIGDGFAIITDKDGVAGAGGDVSQVESFNNTRVVPWGPTISRQYHYWEQHRLRVIYRIRNGVGVFSRYKKSLGKLRDGYPFYLVDGDIVECTPTEISHRIDKLYPLKMNSNRRFLSTYLTESGVDSELVEAFLSHWETGREPFGPLSMFDIHDYLLEMGAAVEKLLEECQFLPIPGPFRKMKDER